MLTADLVEARVRKGEVTPRWVDPGDEARLALAERLIAEVDTGLGRPLGEIEAALEELAGSATEFRLHRGLVKLLFDRCTFETVAAAEPEAVREAVFAVAAEAWRRQPDEGVRFRFDRDRVLAAAAREADRTSGDDGAEADGGSGRPGRDALRLDATGLDAAGLDAALYADLKREQALTAFEPCTPRWLLDRYNLALAQGVLLRASELTVRIAGQTARRYRALFRKIKFFRLLHRIEPLADGGYRIRLDGPLSLFRSSQRYGVQMASFLPTLVHFDGWRLEARVRWGRARRERSFHLAPESAPLRPIGRLTGQWLPDEIALLAERLAAREEDGEDGWRTLRDPELIDLGGDGVLVPDLAFEHRPTGRRGYLEVIGYWNRGTLASRLAQLRRAGPPGLVVAVSKALAAGEGGLDDSVAGEGSEVYVYTRTPSAPRVLAALDRTLPDDDGG